MKKIPVGIVGYGNIGRGAEKAINASEDMMLKAVFTRRDPKSVLISSKNVEVLPFEKAFKMKNEIDTLVLCSGSATDLPEQSVKFAEYFNIVDSYDNHTEILNHLMRVDSAAKDTTAVIAAGWDPGLFSISRSIMGSVLPGSGSHTFWGRGVSQGHSEVLRHIEGVIDAVQYTLPIEKAVESARRGEMKVLSPTDRHQRLCYVVIEDSADKNEIERQIKSIPYYFENYDTTVNFISLEELRRDHSKMPHGGMVIHSGEIDGGKHIMEFSLKLESNADFTASVMVCYARAASRLAKEGSFGAKTVFDIPLSYLSTNNRETLIKSLL